jgi:hypothetical protein
MGHDRPDDHRRAGPVVEAEVDARKNAGSSGSGGWDERALCPQVAGREVTFGSEIAEDLAYET